MQALTLLLLRLSTGIYLILWGLMKFIAQEQATAVSEKYYNGLLNADILNYGIGALEVLVGLLVSLGLFRRPIYLLQAAIYLVGLLAITPYILDPFGLYWASASKLTFFPSTTLFFASMVMVVFMSADTLCLDKKRKG